MPRHAVDPAAESFQFSADFVHALAHFPVVGVQLPNGVGVPPVVACPEPTDSPVHIFSTVLLSPLEKYITGALLHARHEADGRFDDQEQDGGGNESKAGDGGENGRLGECCV